MTSDTPSDDVLPPEDPLANANDSTNAVDPETQESPITVGKSNGNFLRYLYNDNPFYVISAFLMIYAVRTGYGKLVIGDINTSLMMGVLAVYTLTLAGIVILIVRKGKVWDDARSIFVLLLLLFLAVSISADDLFNTSTSYSAGTALLIGGYLFSAIVSEIVLRGIGIQLRAGYRIPYHLLLALFYAAPWWYAPEIHFRDPASLEWSLLAFPVVSALPMLCLIPAVRGGSAYMEGNGTPWRWPWFPGIGFGVFAAVTAFRSYALCMTFGPTGPIWRYHHSGKMINFDTIWGPYFLVPLGFACLILLMEIGIVTGNKPMLRGLMFAASGLLILALLHGTGVVQNRFHINVVTTIGSPMWLTTWGLLVFYMQAWWRRVPLAGIGILATVLLLSVVGPATVSARTMTAPQPWIYGLVGIACLARGMANRSSILCATGTLICSFGLWNTLSDTALAAYRHSISIQVLWFTWVIIGLSIRDEFSKTLRALTALSVPLFALVAMNSATFREYSMNWRVSYVVGLTIVTLVIARVWRDRWYFASFTMLLMGGLYAGAAKLFHVSAHVINRTALTAFLWSVAALILGFMISAHKANWLPLRITVPPSDGEEPPSNSV